MWGREIGHPRNYRALWAAIRLTPAPLRNVWRYLTASGTYPYSPAVRTPTGIVAPRLDSFHDMMTFNEIFLREDYLLPEQARTVVDLGSNRGISALYFLTRNRDVRVWLYEPVPANLERLRANLAGFEDRYRLHDVAVGTQSGSISFNVEPTGRYGGIGVATEEAITVVCKDINTVVAAVLATEPHIDLLKIDIEGLEMEVVEAIDPTYLPRIHAICFEWEAPDLQPLNEFYDSTFFNETYRLTLRT